MGMNTTDKVLYGLLVLGIWTLIFWFVNRTVRINISRKKLDDTKNRIVSIIHGLLAFWLCTITLLIQPNLLDKTNSHTVNILMLISITYFIYDTIACMVYGLMDKSMLMHHLVCIFALGLCLIGFEGTFYLIVGMSVAEISNFPMHIRMILRNLGLKFTRLYQLSEDIYFFLYILARGILSPMLLLTPALLNPNISLGLKGLILFIHAQSFYFIYEMIGIAKKNRARAEQMKQKNIEYDWFGENPQKLAALSFYKKFE